MKPLALILLVGGLLGLIYGGFSYTKDSHTASLGPFSLSVVDRETVAIPLWASVAALVAGGALLVAGQRKR